MLTAILLAVLLVADSVLAVSADRAASLYPESRRIYRACQVGFLVLAAIFAALLWGAVFG